MSYLPRVWTLVTLLMAASLFAESKTDLTPAECQDEVLSKAKKTFMSLYHARQEDPSAVSLGEFRQASRNYAHLAESCYEEKYGRSAETGRIIDHGGMRAEDQDPSGSSRDFYGPGLRHGTSDPGSGLSNPVSDSRSPYVLNGKKWGSGTSFASGSDVAGPGIAGGTVTYSFMATGVDLGTHANDNSDNVAISGNCPDVHGSNSKMQGEIRAAFAAWEAVANIQFLEVTDSGHAYNASGATGDIRIGMHYFDGASGVLAHGYYPPPNGISAAGDIHFDVDETWGCDPEKTQAPEFDLGIVMMHEIGHAIGIKHESSPYAGSTNELALMNPSYNGSVHIPLADDIQAAQQIYGSAFQDKLFFGTVGISTSSPSEKLEVAGNIKMSSSINWVGWSDTVGLINSGGGKPMFVSPGQVLLGIDVNNNDNSQFFAVGKDSLDPAHWTELFRVQENGNVGIGKINPRYPMEFASGARVTSGGQFQNSSSRQSKERIQDLTDSEAAEVVSKLEPVRFAYKADPEENQVGFIAEDVPDLVATKDRKTLAAMGIVAALTKVVQQQQETNQQQQAAILELSAKVAQLQEQVVRNQEK